MDSVLNFPMYYAVVDAFGQPNGPMRNLTAALATVQKAFPVRCCRLRSTGSTDATAQDPGLLGNFLENHDLPRWRNSTADPQLAYNALVWSFMSDGIPIGTSHIHLSNLGTDESSLLRPRARCL